MKCVAKITHNNVPSFLSVGEFDIFQFLFAKLAIKTDSYNLLFIPVKNTRFLPSGINSSRIEIIVAPVVTKSSKTMMLASVGGVLPKVKTAPTRCLLGHSARSS